MTNIVVRQTNKLAELLNIEPTDELVSVLKATAFKGQVSDSQMAALLIVATQYRLNPWTKEIYAFPDKQNGIVPVVGVDGWARIINEHSEFDGMEFRQSETMVKPDGCTNTAPEWMECVMYRKDRSRPIVVREYLDEVYRAPFKKDNGYVVTGPWQTHTKRFLRHKTMIQCARLAFGFTGIYDEDEADRIKDIGAGDSAGNPVMQAGHTVQRRSAAATQQPAEAEVIEVQATEVVTKAEARRPAEKPAQATSQQASKADADPVDPIANEAWTTALHARAKAKNLPMDDVLKHFKLAKLEGITESKAMEIAHYIATAEGAPF